MIVQAPFGFTVLTILCTISAKHILWLKDNIPNEITDLLQKLVIGVSTNIVMDTSYNLSCPLLMYTEEESSIKWKVIFHDSWQFYGPTSWLINETEKYHHAIIVLYILTLVDCHIHTCMYKSLVQMSKHIHALESLSLFLSVLILLIRFRTCYQWLAFVNQLDRGSIFWYQIN